MSQFAAFLHAVHSPEGLPEEDEDEERPAKRARAAAAPSKKKPRATQEAPLSATSKAAVVVVNGYYPLLTLRSLLATIASATLSRVFTGRTVLEQCERLCAALRLVLSFPCSHASVSY